MTATVLQGAAPLSHLGVIRALGPEAASFLHNQLTQDISLLGAAEARLAALCSPKGRMLASFVVVRPDPEQVLLVCSADLLAATLKRLSMFVLRAKVKLSDATADLALYGLAGAALTANGVDADAPPGQRAVLAGDASAVTLYPADGVPRALWIAPTGGTPKGEALDPAIWQWSEVRSGIVTLSTPVVDAFVPQMLNFESVGGVNFKKGCYPGQEVVARSQFRGTLKRRAFLAHADSALAVGQEVFGGDDDEQPVGTVAQSAPAPAGGWDALVSMQVAAQSAGRLRVTDQAPLTLEPLPYPLLEDI